MRFSDIFVAAAMVGLAQLCASGQTLPAHPQPSQPTLDETFEKEMTNVALVGSSTTNGKPNPGQDRYTIKKVSKNDGDSWIFLVPMKIDDREIDMPLKIAVKWAGDTPVITLTDYGIPGLGTFTARVMVYKGHYAGTWSSKDHSGEMWGQVEHIQGPTTKVTTAPATQPATEPTTGPATRP